mgnify:CR=1 FL=1
MSSLIQIKQMRWILFLWLLPCSLAFSEPLMSRDSGAVKPASADRASWPSVQQLVVGSEPVMEVEKPDLKKKTSTVVAKKSQFVSGKSKVLLNGFLSAGASQSNAGDDTYYPVPGRGAVSNQIGFAANSLVGLQVTALLTPWADAVTQFVASGDSTNGNRAYSLNSGWAFLRLKLSPHAQLHVGRFRLPLFLYSSTQQVGYSYPWQYLPGEVYRIVPFDNINGVSTVLVKNIADTGWRLRFQPFFGENQSDYSLNLIGQNTIKPTQVTLQENNVAGAQASVGNLHFTLSGAYAHMQLLGKAAKGFKLNEKNANFWSVGAKLNTSSVFLAAEFADRNLSNQLNALRGYYATAGLRLHKWMPTITYANLSTTNEGSKKLKEAIQDQTSYSFSLDYFINTKLVAKSSISYVMPNGTVGLFDQQPNKKAVFIYGAELDAVF